MPYLLDEQIGQPERQALARLGVSGKQMGFEIRPKPLRTDDALVIRILQGMKNVTFITCNVKDFYHASLRHNRYCLLGVDGEIEHVPAIVHRVLHHPQFKTIAQRLGKVIRASLKRISYFELGSNQEVSLVLD